MFSVLPRLLGLAMALLLAAGCGRKPAPAPAAAEKPKTESDLGRTTLSSDQADSLKVRSEPARIESVQEHRERTGWVMPRQGDEVTLTAPVAGIVVQDKAMPTPGLDMKKGHELFALEPVVPPLDQVQLASLKRTIDNDLAKARQSADLAESELKRVKDLFELKLRGQQDLEQAQARLVHAKEDLASAADRQKLFAPHDKGKAALPPVPIVAPRAGRLLSVLVSPGQYVAAGTPLAAAADLSKLWVRVPIAEQDLPRVDGQRGASVVLPSAPDKRLEAKPLALVPAVEPGRHTADLLYELPDGQQLFKDQMVSVFVPLGEKREETVVPYTAVVFDAFAGTWIYLDRTPDGAAEHVYERKRVQLGAAIGKDVVVRPGCKASDRVVVAGAAALFSREFHKPPVTKAQAVEDDD